MAVAPLKRRLRLMIFDFNGTVFDDLLKLAYGSVRMIFEMLGLPNPTLEEYKAEVGTDYMRFYHNHGVPEWITADQLNVIRGLYYASRRDAAQLRPEFEPTVRELASRGVMLAICSAELEDIIYRYLDAANLTNLFPDWGVRCLVKDKSQILRELCDLSGVFPGEAGYVDDSFSGLTAARMAGLVPIGFDNPTGYAPSDVISSAQPSVIIHELSDLLTLIQ
jgi:beta-phosphoglucomutase-like phosphatase (HAD superfamily)